MGSSNVNLFIWIFNPANIENGAVCIRFTEKKITGQLPYHLNDPELFESANTYQVYSHSRTGGKCNKNQCCFSHDRRFTEQTIITKPFDSKLMKMMKMMKSKIFWHEGIIQVLKPDKSYIYSNFNSGRVNVIDLIKDNFTLPPSVKEVLDKLESSKDDYYRAISISKDEQLELYLKKETNSCFINNYFNVGFKAWRANMGIQPAFN